MNFGANKLLNDTVVAVASSGAIGIVKLSGEDAQVIASKICKLQTFSPRYAHLVSLYDEDSLIDKAIVIFFQSPASFTGEDVIEFQCHGGEMLASLIVELCIKYGARLARAGEFSYRAVLNKKLTLAQAEAASALANAQSKHAIKVLASNLSGKLNEFVNDIKARLLELLAYSETSIDYSDEDLTDDLAYILGLKLQDTLEIVEQTLVSSKVRQGLFDGFKIALIGKPNVGKSSLLNSLLAYERAIVSDIAGTTRDRVEEWIHIGDFRAKLIDTAGIRYTQDTIESFGIKLSLAAFEEANIIVALFDSSNPLDDEDEKIINLISNASDKTIIVALTKSDLEQKINHQDFGNMTVVNVSKYSNNTNLLNTLEEKLKTLDTFDGMSLVSTRQISALEQVLNNLRLAKDNIYTLELFSINILDAIGSLGDVIDPPVYDELLDVVFGTFCLGK